MRLCQRWRVCAHMLVCECGAENKEGKEKRKRFRRSLFPSDAASVLCHWHTLKVHTWHMQIIITAYAERVTNDPSSQTLGQNSSRRDIIFVLTSLITCGNAGGESAEGRGKERERRLTPSPVSLTGWAKLKHTICSLTKASSSFHTFQNVFSLPSETLFQRCYSKVWLACLAMNNNFFFSL